MLPVLAGAGLAAGAVGFFAAGALDAAGLLAAGRLAAGLATGLAAGLAAGALAGVAGLLPAGVRRRLAALGATPCSSAWLAARSTSATPSASFRLCSASCLSLAI
ncbi:hypothetical protein DNJ96_13435 [Stutzerimonas kirkiae]|uniref:Uncharacterized protein n=1 Tax=Stutzerimonas kirkiae TaxID=2211392 RepID=A0A4Q9R3L4_9GAMM|nr:hypothetical protein DNJ96_13435 [Stutzerimonas kirkiae]TBV13689.1 hypothetical protein DNK01_10905 [Stutzerimonas kirkiae]